MRHAKHEKYYLFLMLTVLLCAFFTACGKNDTPLLKKNNTKAAGTYAVILKSTADSTVKPLRQGVETEAARQGKSVDFFYPKNASDVQGQIEMLAACVESGYQAIGVVPLAADADFTQGIAAAEKQGIRVVLFGETVCSHTVEAANGAEAIVTVNAEKQGKLGAQYIVSKLTRGGGVAILSETTLETPQKQGAEAVFRLTSGIDLLESETMTETSLPLRKRAEQLIKQNPNLKAIYCCSDAAALEVWKSVKATGKTEDIIIVGTGGTEAARKSIENRELTATIAVDYAEIGATAFQKMAEINENGAATATKIIYVDPYIAEP